MKIIIRLGSRLAALALAAVFSLIAGTAGAGGTNVCNCSILYSDIRGYVTVNGAPTPGVHISVYCCDTGSLVTCPNADPLSTAIMVDESYAGCASGCILTNYHVAFNNSSSGGNCNSGCSAIPGLNFFGEYCPLDVYLVFSYGACCQTVSCAQVEAAYSASVSNACLPGGAIINVNLTCATPPPTANCVTITAVENTPITPVTLVGSGGCGGPYTFTATGLPPGLVISPSGTISGTPTSSGTFDYTVTITDNCGNTGTNNCSVTVTTPPCPCNPESIQYNFNGTQIIFQSTPGGSYVWFISDGQINGVPSTGATLHISSQTITIPATGSSPQYVVPVPDSYITFSPSATIATTTFSTASNAWITTFPTSSLAGNYFYGGVAFKVPAAGLPAGIQNVDWTGQFTTTTPGLSIHWQWSAAAYSDFTSTYNSLDIKPTDDNQKSAYQTSDHAGTPEGTDSVSGQPWKNFVEGGASGGGGGNYTGSGSSTIQFPPCVCSNSNVGN